MKSEYEKLIAEHDKTLSMLRQQWIESDMKEKSKYMARIDAALDERLRLMKLRDNEI